MRDVDSIGHKARNVTIKKLEIDKFKIKIVTFIVNFGRKDIIRDGQMEVLKRGFSIRGISFIKLDKSI